MKQLFLIALGLVSVSGSCFANSLVDLSRRNAVFVMGAYQIGQQVATSTGSGFFLDQTHVATCYHVVHPTIPSTGASTVVTVSSMKVLVSDGEVIAADLVTLPLTEDKAPSDDDFAILKLKKTPNITLTGCPLAQDVPQQAIGSPVMFSGYPLYNESPGYKTDDPKTLFLHTFIGTLSGISHDLLGLQAPINHGSSGSAVFNMKGKVIGIVNFEHSTFDSIYQQAANMNIGLNQMSPAEKSSVVLLFQLIQQLSQTNSNGIGYARSIDGLRNYIGRHPAVLKE